jgi:hypothetical protein
MKDKRKILRYLISLTALLLVVLTFTPLILRPGVIQPKFLSMPFTLWASIIVTILLVLLTYLASKVQGDE